MNIDKITKAVRKHHGGFDKANPHEIMALWNSLDAETQKRYLKPENKKNDNNPGNSGGPANDAEDSS